MILLSNTTILQPPSSHLLFRVVLLAKYRYGSHPRPSRTLVALAGTGTAQSAFSPANYFLNFPDQFNGTIDIRQFQTTLVAPKVPNPVTNNVALWPGVQTAGPDGVIGLVQSIIASSGSPGEGTPNACNGKPGQWCAFTYEFLNDNYTSTAGPAVEVDVGSHLVMDYAQEGPNYHQTITVNGKVISSLTGDSHGPGYCFYTAVECHPPFDEQVPAHEYLNTTITLSAQHPNFNNNTVSQDMVNATPLYTTDGGTTWKIDRISVEESHCNATAA